MSPDDVSRIRIGDSPVGIIGLEAVLEGLAKEYAGRPDREVMEALIQQLSRRNYIPQKAMEAYGKAFLREYKKFIGKPYEEEATRGIEIKVLGAGCPQCDRLERELQEVMTETGIMADLEHVRDLKEIGRYGVMGAPALVINGEVKAVGTIPSKTRLKVWIKQAADEATS